MRCVMLILTKSHEHVDMNIEVELLAFLANRRYFQFCRRHKCPSGWVAPEGMTELLCATCL